jgi:DNA-binding Lrp family transcriptional regulator
LFNCATRERTEIQAHREIAKAAERVSLRPPAIQQRLKRLQVRATLQFSV